MLNISVNAEMSSTLSSTTVPSSTTTASSTITASSSETSSSTMSHVKDEDKYLVAIDIGTTTIRCQVLNSNALTVGSYRNKVSLLKNFFCKFIFTNRTIYR